MTQPPRRLILGKDVFLIHFYDLKTKLTKDEKWNVNNHRHEQDQNIFNDKLKHEKPQYEISELQAKIIVDGNYKSSETYCTPTMRWGNVCILHVHV